MNINSNKDLLLAMLEGIKPELGLITNIRNYNDNILLIIIHDCSCISFSNSKSVFIIINFLVNTRYVKLVAIDGANEKIDTGWLSDIQDLDFKKQMVDNLFEDGKLTPAEYCHICSSTPFTLFGPEDKVIYQKAEKLWAKITPLREYLYKRGNTEEALNEALNKPELSSHFSEFLEFDKLDHKRAEIFLMNMLKKMNEKDIDIAVLICKGNLPKYISEIAINKAISHIIIDPAKINDDNFSDYEERFKEQLKISENEKQ